MRWKIEPKLEPPKPPRYYWWFAWYPVKTKAFVWPGKNWNDNLDEHYCPELWVWLERVVVDRETWGVDGYKSYYPNHERIRGLVPTKEVA